MLHFALCDDDPAALPAAKQRCFDVYLPDVPMPDENGIQLGAELRKLDRNGVFIYLTSSPNHALCGVSYAVDLDHVMRVGQSQIHLRGERTVPLSRAYRNESTGRWSPLPTGRDRGSEREALWPLRKNTTRSAFSGLKMGGLSCRSRFSRSLFRTRRKK